MRVISLLLFATAVLGASVVLAEEPAGSPAGFRFQAVSEQSLGLWENGKPVLVYNHGMIARPGAPGSRARACYFHPVYGLDGEVITDDFPKDHLYHRGMYWAWPHIKAGEKEYDLWSARGELRHVFGRWLTKEANADGARLSVENGWFDGEKQLVREQVLLAVHPAVAESRAIDVELRWTPLDLPLTLSGAEGKSYGGFNFRFGPRTKTIITVPEDAKLPDGIAAPAGRTSGDLLVTKLPWADFTADFSGPGKLSGAAIFVHPQHRDYPPTWMTRHYGLVSVGWPGVDPQTFPAGHTITCRYRVWIHRGSPAAAEIQKAYGEYRAASVEDTPANAVLQPIQPDAGHVAAAEAAIHEQGLRGHIRFLASDLLEGRGPGSRGDELAQQYIAAQFESLGLKPAAPGGGWFQPVPLVGVTARVPATARFRHGQESLELKRHDDFVFASGKPHDNVRVENAELVFVGYGIQAPEFQWDDFKKTDLRGKILLMMNNDPADDPALFAGKRRLYYGRWDYKYESAARQGAAGALIIHTAPSAGYPFQVVQTSWSGEEFELDQSAGPRLEMQGWFTEDASRRIATLGGQDLDKLRAAAERRDFKPVPLGVQLSVEFPCNVRKRQTGNVLGMLPGSDPALAQQAVVFMAHHDHLGLAAQRDAQGDNIYNGAIDNASGTAALLTIARACASLKDRPARSILFAAVGAEEQGLLGSEYFAAHPPLPAGNLAAVVNIDGLNIIGPTQDVNVIGLGKSDLDKLVEGIARWQKRVVTADQFPDRGFYYRSDQFSLAKVGVPGVYLHSGVNVIGKPEGWGKQQMEEWTRTKYHQPSDEYDESWDLRGAVEDVRLLYYIGLQAAQRPDLPQWNPGDEFEAARKAARAAATK